MIINYHKTHTAKDGKYYINISKQEERGIVIGEINYSRKNLLRVKSYATNNVKRWLNNRIKQLNTVRYIDPPIPQIKANFACKNTGANP
ncbi:hypothetical protein [Lonepinella sp. BR2930]|uniref:hypothetical protein n=1 Tax=Lonepinella sp. BR2930 TaxID=3434554 RepID=UPI003F6E1405